MRGRNKFIAVKKKKMSKYSSRFSISFISSVISVILSLILILTSLSFYPTPYNPTQNLMSELGWYKMNPKGAIFFNLYCILNGILWLPYFYGFKIWYSTDIDNTVRNLAIRTQKCGYFLGFIEILVGFVTEDFLIPHGILTAILFITNYIIFLLGGIFYFKHPQAMKGIAVYSIIAIFIMTFFIILWNPILEWIIVMIGLFYALIVGYNIQVIYRWINLQNNSVSRN